MPTRSPSFLELQRQRTQKTGALSPSVDRRSAHARGYTYRWRKVARMFLSSNPLCVYCQAEGRVTEATEIDHFVPHKGDQQLFWDESNWRATCKSCHSHKTSTEDGGFGRTHA